METDINEMVERVTTRSSKIDLLIPDAGNFADMERPPSNDSDCRDLNLLQEMTAAA
jgi:hypothetical protein